MSAPANKLPLPKLRLLHVARRELAIGDDDWRTLLARCAGVVSTADLEEPAFDRVMLELNRLGFHSTRSRKGYGHRPGFASPKQIALARELWREWHGEDADADVAEAGLNAWLTRFHHVSALRFVSVEKIGAVLVALKQMVGRRRNAR